MVEHRQGGEPTATGVSDYRVIAKKSPRRMRQRFYVLCVAANGETIWTSELYRDKDHAVKTAQEWAGYCDGNFIDAT